jgi:hypothetical protein
MVRIVRLGTADWKGEAMLRQGNRISEQRHAPGAIGIVQPARLSFPGKGKLHIDM